MQLPKLAINNFQFVLILVFLSVLLGTVSFMNMPRSEDPGLNIPIYRVVCIYPGTSPKDMEELVVDPIEEAINEVEEVDDIRTTIEEGMVVMRIEAEFGVDIDDVHDEIRANVNAIARDLPDGIVQLDVEKVSPQDVKILQLALVSDDAPYAELNAIAEDLEDHIENLKGLRSVDIEACPEEEIRVSMDLQKMANLEISLQQVMGTLQGNNANIPGGDIKSGNKSFTIQTSGGYKSLSELENSVISSYNGQLIFLKDIAQISFDYEDLRYIGRFNGKRAIFITVTQKDGANIIFLADAIREKTNMFEKTLPSHIKLETAFEQAPAVKLRINDFFVNLLQGVLLVGAVIFIFLGGRPSLIIMTVIPTSIIIAIGLLDLNGFSLQQISIAGLVIALGLLVDNGIVVVENIMRYLKEGATLKDAAVKGTTEVGWAIISSTVTTVLSFFPITQIENATGEFLQTLPLIVVFSLTASLVLALTFTPLVAGKFLKAGSKMQMKWVDKLLDNLVEKVYARLLTFSLKKPWLIVAVAVFTFLGSLALFPLVGVSLFPTADKPLVLVDINTPNGTNLDRTDEAARYVESLIDSMDYVVSYASNVGSGNPRVYYNRVPIQFKKSHAQLLINLEDWENDKFYALIAYLRAKAETYSGAKVTISELKNGPDYEAPITIKILGDEMDTLKRIAADVEKLIEETPGTINVDNPLSISKTDIKVNINKDKAGISGVSLADIDMAIRAGLTGVTVSEVSFDNGDKYNLVVRLPFDEKPGIEDFNKIYVPNRNGQMIPLNQLASLAFQAGASQIFHFNLTRNANVLADVIEGYNLNEVTMSVIDQLNNYNFPEGYSYYVAGEYENQQESFGSLGQILVGALIAIFAVLVLQFKSFRQPFIVFSAIPLAFTGSIVFLFLTGWSFSFFAFVGFTSLVGIVINTSIILVDYSNQLVAGGMQIEDAIIKAAKTRFTPILLTTLTTILGLLPLTLTNSNLWSPLGWTIIGGMISSTLLTLLLVPVLYKWFTHKKRAEMAVI
ncbi:efflux RND transporter permease subunit [Chondrinema litorale]|uniref:efflux RND transporter permease subunit n=1 Tax=Chondrinema litorale TaxID=2994555 RepID=UPI0025431BAB|nr:efflux RND transporter permease subunit [Chondrinema litorale]UZR93812.1 efflux RND transporter permease subunit [Chondrinema litorale]